MAHYTLKMAQHAFEERFKEVHTYTQKTHPARLTPAVSPAGVPYFVVNSGGLRWEGEESKFFPSEQEAIDFWLEAIFRFGDLTGWPKYLWWREEPVLNKTPRGWTVYSRLVCTQRSPFVSFRGKAKKYK